jgi:hypothetical protein
MFDKLRERIRTREAYMNAPVTYEVLGTQSDEKDVKWFRRHFGHRSLRAMFYLYFTYGAVISTVATTIAIGEVGQATIFGFTLSVFFAVMLLSEWHESRKVP